MSFNRAEFIGNLGSDARIAKVGDKDVANFSIAVEDKKNDATIWIRCALWGALVPKIGSYLTKGKMVMVAGPVRIEEWTNKDGEVKRDLSVMVNDIQLLGGGADKQESKPASKPKADPTQENPFA
jgi:single-strand DNA-binding protein